jgi:hypothetical protein
LFFDNELKIVVDKFSDPDIIDVVELIVTQ